MDGVAWRDDCLVRRRKLIGGGEGRDEIEAVYRCIGEETMERRGELVPGSGTRAALERDGNGWWKNNARRRKDFSGWEMGKFSSLPRIIIEMAGKFCWEIIKN